DGIQSVRPPILLFAGLVDERSDGTVAERPPAVRADQLRVEFRLRAESRTIGTRTVRRVERELARLQLRHVEPAGDAGIGFGEELVDPLGGVGGGVLGV